jgi:WbqC-like protein family
MTCVILQPSYIPWRGYFHLIQKSDVFVFYDDVQYDKHGWRNRNRLKFPTGVQWLTIPVKAKGNTTAHILIKDVKILEDKAWHKNHRQTIHFGYSKAPYYKKYAPLLDHFYSQQAASLADFTIDSTMILARELGIEKTRFLRSSALSASGVKSDRLLEILTSLGATHYVSGPSARDYMELDKFAAAGITVEFMQYVYPEYPQLHGTFEPQVSILDLMMMTGPDAPRYIWDRSISPAGTPH